MSPDDDLLARFTDRYSQPLSDAALIVEREVIGANVGANGYTTLRQADALITHLDLRPGRRLLDVGGGRGWPGLYLAEKTGCTAMLTDVPEPGIRIAEKRASATSLRRRVSCLRAAGGSLPFRAGAFDAVVHTDTL